MSAGPSDKADHHSTGIGTDRYPRVGVGAVVFHDARVLLVLRAQAPNADQWAIPGGRLNWGESLQAAAEREILEETGVRIRAGEPIFTFDVIERDESAACSRHYVVVDLAAQYLGGEPCADDDARDAHWVGADELDALPVNATTRKLLRERFGFG